MTFTPAAPQRGVVQAGAADLDGVVHAGLQVQGRPIFSRHGHDLETQQPRTVGRTLRLSSASLLVLSLPARLDEPFRESIGPRT